MRIVQLVTALSLALSAGNVAAQRAESAGAKASINERFLDPKLDVSKWVARFEGESREVFAKRSQIVKALSIKPGTRVADIGAGTGLFTNLFDKAVGTSGAVYAVEISPRFLDHLRRRQRRNKWRAVHIIEGTNRSPKLPPGSVDLIFVCDTYHHFEQPGPVLAGMRSALRPGGRLVVIDFHRIPGRSRKWILGHVRAGKKTFRAEIERAGFDFKRDLAIDGLRDNYAIEFVKRK